MQALIQIKSLFRKTTGNEQPPVSKNEPFSDSLYLKLGLPVIIFVPIIYLVTVSAFSFGISISKLYLPLGILLSLGLTWYYSHRSIKTTIQSSLLFLSIIALGLWLNIFFLDSAYDTQLYHFKAIYYLATGWNPTYHFIYCDQFPNQVCEYAPFAVYYPKSAWIISAIFYSFFDTIGSSHVSNLIMIFISSCVAYEFSRRVLKINNFASICFCVLWSSNPCSIGQVFTNYVDGTHATALSVVFLAVLLFFETSRRLWLCILVLYIPFLVNVKFTSSIFTIFFLLYFSALGFRNKYSLRAKTFFKSTICSLLFGLLIVGHNPYIFNTFFAPHPFYPAINPSEKTDIIAHLVDDHFIHKNRFRKTLESIFSTTDTSGPRPELRGEKTKFKPKLVLPFTYFKTNIEFFSGNGPLFGPALLLALFLVADLNFTGWIVFLGVCFSVFLTSSGWYARLNPQLWWIPILLSGLVYSKTFSFGGIRNGFKLLVIMAMSITLAADCWIVSKQTYTRQWSDTVEFRHALTSLHNDVIHYKVNRSLFRLQKPILLKEETHKTVTSVSSCIRYLDTSTINLLNGIQICLE